jgi:uncharacterized membrane protein YhaH (DUF805 family)
MSSKQIPVSEVALVFLCVPKLHDIGRSGWFVLIGVALELAGLVIGFSFFSLETAKAVTGVAVLAMAGLLVWLGTVRGDPNANRWGDPPPSGIQFRRRAKAENGSPPA